MTNDTYHRMVDHALIQGQWEPKIWHRTDRGVVVGVSHPKRPDATRGTLVTVWERGTTTNPKKHYVWYPTQEDLQGMLLEELEWDLYHRPANDVLPDYQFAIRRNGRIIELERFYADTPKEALVKGIMHGRGLRWDDKEGWVEEDKGDE